MRPSPHHETPVVLENAQDERPAHLFARVEVFKTIPMYWLDNHSIRIRILNYTHLNTCTATPPFTAQVLRIQQAQRRLPNKCDKRYSSRHGDAQLGCIRVARLSLGV